VKQCKNCEENLDLDKFHLKAMGKFGRDSVCIVCKKEVNKLKYLANAEKIKARTNAYKASHKEEIKIKAKEYDASNTEAIAERKANYYIKNRDEILTRQTEYVKNNRSKINDYQKNKKNTDINYRLRAILRTRISNFLKGIGGKRGSAVKDLGCSIEEFRKHLESKFTEGMTWDNKGKWHIDHIKALNNFDLTDREEFLKACHYTNMQPLWAIDNIRKSDK
jgi:hypothetical protein